MIKISQINYYNVIIPLSCITGVDTSKFDLAYLINFESVVTGRIGTLLFNRLNSLKLIGFLSGHG